MVLWATLTGMVPGMERGTEKMKTISFFHFLLLKFGFSEKILLYISLPLGIFLSITVFSTPNAANTEILQMRSHAREPCPGAW